MTIYPGETREEAIARHRNNDGLPWRQRILNEEDYIQQLNETRDAGIASDKG